MENFKVNITNKILLLKDARLQILKLHKELIDIERQDYERENGHLSSGQFLQLLLNDENLSWLRKFSMLVAEMDEMFDLDDGFAENMVEKHFLRIENLLNFESTENEFNLKFKNAIKNNSTIKIRYDELRRLIKK